MSFIHHSSTQCKLGLFYKKVVVNNTAIMKGIGSLLAKRLREIEQEIEEYLDRDKGYSYSM